MAGHRSARDALADAKVELILAAGTNLGEWSTCKWDPVLMNDKLVHMHNDRRSFSRSPMARLQVEGDIATLFSQLNTRLEALQREGRLTLPAPSVETVLSPVESYLPAGITVNKPTCCDTSRSDAPIKAPQVYAELIQRLPQETRFFIDNSNSVPWSIHYFFHSRPENYHLSIEFATMAWAVGAAVGGAFGNRRAPSVCLAGDGCYLMSGQEITVAVERQLPVIFVVLNDQGYGLIKHGHRLAGKEPVDFSIPPVDFAMMGRAAGADAHTIRTMRDFDRLDWQALANRQGPTLLEVIIDPRNNRPSPWPETLPEKQARQTVHPSASLLFGFCLPSSLARTETNGQCAYNPQRQDQQAESDHGCCGGLMLLVKPEDHFPNDNDDGRIHHGMQANAVILEVINKAAE